MLRQVRIDVTTDASGDGVTTVDMPVMGRKLYAVEWRKGDYADGVDAVLAVVGTSSGTTNTLLTLTDANSSAWYYPRYVVHSEAGAALTGTNGGDRGQAIINGNLRLTVDDGGNAKSGGVVVWFEA